MNVAVQLEFKADRKEQLGGLRTTSAVERALKKHPHLARFERNDAPLQARGIPAMRRLTTGDRSDPFQIADVLALADGVPRSLPFHGVSVHFVHEDFGRAAFMPGLAPPTGIAIGDSWWVNGRNRSLSAIYVVEADRGLEEAS